ncbi:PAS domain-containing protein [Sphingosinicella sp. LHD-64]|uniref:PAS domain-containing protein n=1 Tax=Sphingosinicella sp. LHD-64 TaxID=3072139 RepID=UPI00280DAC29|nr:PAS domain-containing protein [Sphingosinicella sp. LHD-64]MDQ8754779.1 PAS domain-containing protein [Sphingosinicella sp. LHD-64]
MGVIRNAEPGPVATHVATPDAMIETILIAPDDEARRASIDSLSVPAYLTDADGWLIHFNAACVAFAGRTPEPGRDRWCVTWRLYTEGGAFMPVDKCPMAAATEQGISIRGAIAVAEREDGSRVTFLPYPTPIMDPHGRMTGAVNLLIDITDASQPDALQAQAARCRRLAGSVNDARTVETLLGMAGEFEAAALSLRSES